MLIGLSPVQAPVVLVDSAVVIASVDWSASGVVVVVPVLLVVALASLIAVASVADKAAAVP